MVNQTLALAIPHLDTVAAAIAYARALLEAATHHAPALVDPSATVVWSKPWGGAAK